LISDKDALLTTAKTKSRLSTWWQCKTCTGYSADKDPRKSQGGAKLFPKLPHRFAAKATPLPHLWHRGIWEIDNDRAMDAGNPPRVRPH
jgi:hypothetical protein